MRAIIIISAAALAASCSGGDEPAQSERAVSAPPTEQESANPQTEPALAADNRAILIFGDVTITFDSVICVPGLKQSAIASDRQKRTGFPTIVVGWSDAAQTGGAVRNSVSVDFDDGDERRLWLLDTGDVEKTESGFTAEGTLRGSRMIEQPNGNHKREPLQDGAVKSFNLKLRCR